jgi:hypothetical protein
MDTREEIPGACHPFPGGKDAPMYRIAFQAWVLFFLLLICAGLVNYLGIMFKK